MNQKSHILPWILMLAGAVALFLLTYTALAFFVPRLMSNVDAQAQPTQQTTLPPWLQKAEVQKVHWRESLITTPITTPLGRAAVESLNDLFVKQINFNPPTMLFYSPNINDGSLDKGSFTTIKDGGQW